MNDYVEVKLVLTPSTTDMTDVLAALLADAGYETFVPEESGLTAYVRQDQFSTETLRQVIEQFPFDCVIDTTHTTIEGQDWNSEWEKHYFKPIVVGNKCVIHSSFHTDIPVCDYDIVIDPKMAFGTGHHSTTSLMIRRLLSTDITGKKIIDMGTGTGILAILATMRGAAEATGIEIDPAAYVNAVENCRLNHCEQVKLIEGDASALADIDYMADIVIANINLNVIRADINRYADKLKPGGEMWLSGFYVSDIPAIKEAAAGAGLHYEDFIEDRDWASVRLTKSAATV